MTKVHLLTKDSIEERVCETLKRKKSLFAGVFDSPTAEVSFAALGRKGVLQAVKEIFAEESQRPKPVAAPATQKAIPIDTAAAPALATPSTLRDAGAQTQADGFAQAAAGLLETGVRFLESVARMIENVPAGGPDASIEHKLSRLLSRDPGTQRRVLSIPLPPTVDESRMARAIAGVLSAFRR